MGQAALNFVQRFDLRLVLGEFEKELRALADSLPERANGQVTAIPCAKLD
jgi:hypothetical protein